MVDTKPQFIASTHHNLPPRPRRRSPTRSPLRRRWRERKLRLLRGARRSFLLRGCFLHSCLTEADVSITIVRYNSARLPQSRRAIRLLFWWRGRLIIVLTAAHVVDVNDLGTDHVMQWALTCQNAHSPAVLHLAPTREYLPGHPPRVAFRPCLCNGFPAWQWSAL